MATLRHRESGREERLVGEHTVGRSRSNLLCLESPRASGRHAVLRWAGAGWELRDLGSRNGTWIGGRRLEPGQRQMIQPGALISFGQEGDAWEVVEDGPPALAARGEDGRWAEAEDGLLALPDARQPAVVIYGDDQGRWMVERDDAQWALDGEGGEVEAGGQRWRVYPPSPIARTHTLAAADGPILALGAATLVFLVSQDEEHVELELRPDAGEPLRLPHRAQHYLLLTLARARAEDAAAGESPSEQGWRYRDELCRGLRIPENQFNVTIFRARQHLAAAGLAGADDVVERRRGSGQLRLGTDRFRVEGL